MTTKAALAVSRFCKVIADLDQRLPNLVVLKEIYILHMGENMIKRGHFGDVVID